MPALLQEAQLTAGDLDRGKPMFDADRGLFKEFFSSRAKFLGFTAAALIKRDGTWCEQADVATSPRPGRQTAGADFDDAAQERALVPDPRTRAALVLDGVVITAPNINSAIRHEGIIQGKFTPDEAEQLALLLKSGAFVAPVTFEEERQIGPALGAESIRQGLVSCLVGSCGGLLLLFSDTSSPYALSGIFGIHHLAV